MKKTTIRELYYLTMACQVFGLVCGIAGIIFMLIFANGFIDIAGKVFGIIFIIVVVCGFGMLFVACLKELITILWDLKSIKSNNYISVIGKVVKFKRNINPDSGAQINSIPIVLVLNTNENIELHINDKIMVGETYKFNYLKNSKIAEVVEKI